MVIKRTKISTLTAAIATIAIIAALGSIGGGIGIGQKQIALAQDVNCTPITFVGFSVLTCLSEETIEDLGPACDIIRLNPQEIPSFENFPFDIIQDFCEG
jgi:hypothetical protein